MGEGAKRWRLPPLVEDRALPRDLPPPMAKVLLNRGIDTAEKLRLFLEPPQRLPYDPLRIAGMDRALQRLYRAISREERVGVFGDFDVDGVTGAAIVAEGLEPLGVSVVPYLPHRTEEGHGLSVSAVDQLVAQGVTLIITVDCGVTASDEVAHANRLGIDVIITDHHLPQSGLPDAAAIIDPMLPGGSYPFQDLCGAGLAFKLVQGIYEYHGQPWATRLLELAALGTIADQVSMVDENRYLVQQGLASLAQTQRPGLLALYRLAGVDTAWLDAETLAFQVIPRLNSAGRMGHALDSYWLLTTTSPEEAGALAQRLEGLNQDRRDLTERAVAEAREEVRSHSASGALPAILLVASRGITRGVAGLVAGRLADTFHRPAVAMAMEDGYLVGSGRSIPEFDLFEALTGCQDLFVRFGGHSQAAGFTLATDKLPLLRERLTAAADTALDTRDLSPTLDIDAEVKLAELTSDLVRWLSILQPFGPSNRQPVFLTRRAHVLEARYMGHAGQHLRFKLREGNDEWPAVAFNQADRWVSGTPYMDLVYSVTIDRWRGMERLTLRVQDFRPVAG
ncbi:MAG: single-stranded-DNA-specific exonuclease RecJ [Dehalococcoidia bacterium]|nr:single-stranded-DNA-specific exonuclease RecJ [Dehalococcoidia bacterium]